MLALTDLKECRVSSASAELSSAGGSSRRYGQDPRHSLQDGHVTRGVAVISLHHVTLSIVRSGTLNLCVKNTRENKLSSLMSVWLLTKEGGGMMSLTLIGYSRGRQCHLSMYGREAGNVTCLCVVERQATSLAFVWKRGRQRHLPLFGREAGNVSCLCVGELKYSQRSSNGR
ncbi:unnamed protein product [Timema podura]|uniref:Uncharacterized protein n=1 Tax=Timema podura TaxID=61482 RepID=A0ABN7ND87_TIMPD|nr:unnamed protein product [Timema podura]